MNEHEGRGISHILIAVVDGLKGFPESINAVFPRTGYKPASFISSGIRWILPHGRIASRSRKLKTVYRATDANAGEAGMDAFADGAWGAKYPAIGQSWRRNRNLVIPFFAFPEAVRRIIYTTNAIEALNSKLRRAVWTRGHFPNDDAATKL